MYKQFTFMYKSIQIKCKWHTVMFLCNVDKRGSASSHACSTALTGVYVHHIGTRVSILHTWTDTIFGRGTYCNSVRGVKMPSGSTARSLSCRARYLHTRAACGDHKCLLLPVPACLRAFTSTCLSIPILPPSRAHATSITSYMWIIHIQIGVYIHDYVTVCVCVCVRTSKHTQTHTHTHTQDA